MARGQKKGHWLWTSAPFLSKSRTAESCSWALRASTVDYVFHSGINRCSLSVTARGHLDLRSFRCEVTCLVGYSEGDCVYTTVGAVTFSFRAQLNRCAIGADNDVVSRVAGITANFKLITRNLRDNNLAEIY